MNLNDASVLVAPPDRVRRQFVTGSWTTNASLLGPDARPMPAKKRLPVRGVGRS